MNSKSILSTLVILGIVFTVTACGGGGGGSGTSATSTPSPSAQNQDPKNYTVAPAITPVPAK